MSHLGLAEVTVPFIDGSHSYPALAIKCSYPRFSFPKPYMQNGTPKIPSEDLFR